MKTQYWFLPQKWQNFFIGKDVVQIPLQIKNTYGLNTVMCFIGRDFPDEPLISEHQGIAFKYFSSYPQMIWFLMKEAWKIDLFWTFHVHRQSLLLVIIYKILRLWKWFVVVKWDTSYHSAEKLIQINKAINLSFLFRLINITTVESKIIYSNIITHIPFLKPKLILAGNGFSDSDGPKIAYQRKNIIVVIGVIGNQNKNHDLILRALSNIQPQKEWTVLFIGKIVNNFQEEVEKYSFSDKIHIWFTGPIYDKKQLYNILNEAKIFCHSSFWEGDPLVQYESMYYWLYCISTKCWTIPENYPKQFSKFCDPNDVESYRKNLSDTIALYETTAKEEEIEIIKQIHQCCEENYLWEKTCKELIKHIGAFRENI